MAFHIDILPIAYKNASPEKWGGDPPADGERSVVEIDYTLADCVRRGWLTKKDEGWVWTREIVEVPDGADGYEYVGGPWKDGRCGVVVFGPDELALIGDELCYPLGNGIGLR